MVCCAGKAVNSNFPRKSTYTHTATKLENDVRNCGRQVVWRRGQSCPVTKLRCSHVCGFVPRVSEADNLEQSSFLCSLVSGSVLYTNHQYDLTVSSPNMCSVYRECSRKHSEQDAKTVVTMFVFHTICLHSMDVLFYCRHGRRRKETLGQMVFRWSRQCWSRVLYPSFGST